jgi:hypothetical protein
MIWRPYVLQICNISLKSNTTCNSELENLIVVDRKYLVNNTVCSGGVGFRESNATCSAFYESWALFSAGLLLTRSTKLSLEATRSHSSS